MGTNINFDKILGHTKGCNIILKSIGSQLLLDLYPNAAVAYSLRKLRTAYTGSAIRVRRSSDNAEQDIAFVGNDLDTQTMLDFVGYNLWIYSEDISQTTYVKNQLNTTGTPAYVDVETAPDGTLTGDKIIENTVSGAHYLRRATGTILNATDYNFSAYLKQGERTKVRIESQVSTIIQSCILDLTNGTVSSNTFANTPVVTAVANGWYRFSITITSGTTSQSNGLTIQLINASNQLVYAGDGTSGCFVWGTQLSQTSSVKTYQKTVATAGGNGFVTTWYDQSTNANNSTQATATSQAQVVLNGNLILDVDTNKITTTWTTDSYSLTSGINPNTRYLSISVIRRQTTSGTALGVGNTSLGTVNGQTPLFWTSTGNLRSYMPTLVTHSNIATVDGYIVTSEKNASDLKTMYLNGSAQPTTATEAPSSGTNLNRFGQSGTNHTTGQYQEYIYWDSEQSANRTGIETNINNYWTIY